MQSAYERYLVVLYLANAAEPPLQRQSQSHTLHVDRNRRSNTRKSPETLLIYLWDATLDSGD